MTKKEKEQSIKYIVHYYGLDNQMDKTIEECAELIQALSKYKEKRISKQEKIERRKHIIEEMADVQIMLKQMFYLLDCEKDVKKVMAYKINRQLERMR